VLQRSLELKEVAMGPLCVRYEVTLTQGPLDGLCAIPDTVVVARRLKIREDVICSAEDLILVCDELDVHATIKASGRDGGAGRIGKPGGAEYDVSAPGSRRPVRSRDGP
jgi:hypothetical protein